MKDNYTDTIICCLFLIYVENVEEKLTLIPTRSERGVLTLTGNPVHPSRDVGMLTASYDTV